MHDHPMTALWILEKTPSLILTRICEACFGAFLTSPWLPCNASSINRGRWWSLHSGGVKAGSWSGTTRMMIWLVCTIASMWQSTRDLMSWVSWSYAMTRYELASYRTAGTSCLPLRPSFSPTHAWKVSRPRRRAATTLFSRQQRISCTRSNLCLGSDSGNPCFLFLLVGLTRSRTDFFCMVGHRTTGELQSLQNPSECPL